ncbi:ubiquitin-specific protease UBP2 NDAI_0C01550 [Naumovozyma dairenensis CBS 421]|uniref:Ubiquitin carboxyl-terminal hydrolase 2 n=1 Tax=Naumovozyma dairenensis (strain ATCC 10597 / BCRC 20456 / CBS 421 / NBRC 0211 / NRRL Y-12639) TaxID=1071378 RepID=G0W7Q5_NAUDC|nr:hypothetical protein NDAI_0C01550 [Naumovozyma dairenensis CBS 421]CCD23816.1 hypothetical protein NDAI_0C01550 [Naumovozyma dairenensis CBS 421]
MTFLRPDEDSTKKESSNIDSLNSSFESVNMDQSSTNSDKPDLPSKTNDDETNKSNPNSTGQGPTCDTPRVTTQDIDPGNTLLYPDLGTANFPMKTSNRIIDDILCDLSFINGPNLSFKNGILQESMIMYSKERINNQAYLFGSMVDQVALQTKYEYNSLTCPANNKLEVQFGILMNLPSNITNVDEIISKVPIYHLKITVKTRQLLEVSKKQAGITQYHLLDFEDLHHFDKRDLMTFDPDNPDLLDYAIYVSSDTNRLILIEIFSTEFDSREERESFQTATIKSRYQEACKKFDTLDPEAVPTGIDCLNTVLKLLKQPLTRKNNNDKIRTVSSNNPILHSHFNPEWLLEKYNFTKHYATDETTGQEVLEYEPPDLISYVQGYKVRSLREKYIRRCLQLIFWGKCLVQLRVDQSDPALRGSKSYRAFNLLNTTTSTNPLYQLLNDSKSNFLASTRNDSDSMALDQNFHFINLSTSSYYTDRDIIKNYERLIALDPPNIGTYFDALSYIANRKGSYQLIAYCGKQDVVGQENINMALKCFNIDPNVVNLESIDDSLLLSIYKNESVKEGADFVNLKNAMRLFAKIRNSPQLKFYVDHEPYRNVNQAYETLEIDSSVDDDIIQTAYSIKTVDAPGLKIDCDRALYTIAIQRRSMILFNFLLENCSEFQAYYNIGRYDYRQALGILQVNENANDEVILKNFQTKWFNEQIHEADQFLNYKCALMKLGLERNSKLINNFLMNGVIDPSCLPVENWPTGINNIGNTCYLNSLLQYYFSISPLREYVLGYSKTYEDFYDAKRNAKTIRRIGGREVGDNEVERSIQFIYQLRDLFYAMIYTNKRCVTPRRELAYLAFAPSNVEVEFENGVTDAKEDVSHYNDDKTSDTLIKIGEGDEDLGEAERTEASPTEDIYMTDDDMLGAAKATDGINKEDESTENGIDILPSTKVAKISSDQLENALEMGRQQDVTECIGNVLYQLESGSEPLQINPEDNEQDDLVKQLFYGEIKQDIIPLSGVGETRPKLERFLSLLVNVGDHPRDIYDALDMYFKDEFLTMDEYGEVKRTVAITKFPTILQVQIQRVYYDRERFMPFKSIEPLPFSAKIYMDRYVDTADPEILETRERTAKMKAELVQLKKRQQELLSRNEVGLSRKEAYSETVNFLQSNALQLQGIVFEGQDELSTILKKAGTDIDDELSTIYNQITQLEETISHQFEQFKKVGYSLFAVFIHRGEASYGHYWVYIKDYNQNGIWRKYNDETVSEVPDEEVFNFTEGNTATPYFLVYVKEGSEKDIEPLKRIIEES